MEETCLVRIYRKECGQQAGPEGDETWNLVGTVEDISGSQTRAFHGKEELWSALIPNSQGSLGE